MRCEVWCPTQNGESALNDTAKAAGRPAEQCEVYKLHLGGGSGRRSIHDYITQADFVELKPASNQYHVGLI